MEDSKLSNTAGTPPLISNADWNQLCEIMNGYIYSQALATACDLDLFTFLSDHPGSSVDEIHSKLRISHYAARVLMLACCAAKLVCRDEATGGYFNSDVAQKVLVSGTPHCMVPFVQFNHRVQQRSSVHLTQALRDGRNAGLDEFPGNGNTLYQRLTQYPELECLFQKAMGAYTRLSPKMIDVPEFSDVHQLLDVGGGDGSNAIRLCRHYPELRVTILEIPSVAAIARKNVQEAGLTGRITCVVKDMFEENWPDGHDAVLFSHILEIFSPEKINFLYQKAWNALLPGGKLFVWTIMADDLETKGLQAAKSSIYFLCTASGEGMAYPGKDHVNWIEKTGFSSIKRYNATEIDHGAIVATK